QGTEPSEFSTSIWTTSPGQYPTLNWSVPAGVYQPPVIVPDSSEPGSEGHVAASIVNSLIDNPAAGSAFSFMPAMPPSSPTGSPSGFGTGVTQFYVDERFGK